MVTARSSGQSCSTLFPRWRSEPWGTERKKSPATGVRRPPSPCRPIVSGALASPSAVSNTAPARCGWAAGTRARGVPPPPADVGEVAEPAEVEGVRQRGGGPGHGLAHRRVELGRRLGMLAGMAEEVGAEDGVEGDLTGADALVQVLPGPDERGTGDIRTNDATEPGASGRRSTPTGVTAKVPGARSSSSRASFWPYVPPTVAVLGAPVPGDGVRSPLSDRDGPLPPGSGHGDASPHGPVLAPPVIG